MTKMNSEIKKMWVEALRSGKYRQATGALAVVESSKQASGNCCLGVLCEVAIENGLEISVREYTDEHNERILKKYDFSTGVLPLSVAAWAGLNEDNPSVLYENDKVSVAELNDSRVDFNTIANLIEEQL